MTVRTTRSSYLGRAPFSCLLAGLIASQSVSCAAVNEDADTDLERSEAELVESGRKYTAIAGSAPAAGTQANPNSTIASLQAFAGSLLTASRATSMAEAEGTELIRFYPCPDASDDCAMLEVIGKRGLNTYSYQLSSEPCHTWQATNYGAATISSVPTPYSSSSPSSTTAATARVASSSQTAGTGSQPNPTHSGTTIPSLSDEESFACFGGYRVNFRARIENSLYVEPGSEMFLSSYEYQVYAADNWTPVATVNQRASSWYQGCTEWTSTQLEVLDFEGEEVVNETEVGPGACASSAPYTGDPAEDCKRVADSVDGLLSKLSEWVDVACQAMSLITLTPDEVSIGFESEGGLTIGGTKNLDPCGISKAARDTVAGIAGDAMILTGNETPWMDIYNSCLADPGWYMPSEYGQSANPPAEIQDALQELFTDAAEGESASACPASYVTHVVQDLADGSVCDADVRFECNTQTDGSCECVATAIVGDLVCTS